MCALYYLVCDITKNKEWCIVFCSKNMVEKLETIVEDYKKFQKESRELLGFGHTDKRYIVKKKKMIDEQLKKLKIEWVETLSAIEPEYGNLYENTAPSTKVLNAVKESLNK